MKLTWSQDTNRAKLRNKLMRILTIRPGWCVFLLLILFETYKWPAHRPIHSLCKLLQLESLTMQQRYAGVLLYPNPQPRFNEVERRVYWFHLVRLSVCGQNRVRSVSSTIHTCRIHFIVPHLIRQLKKGVSRVMFVSQLKKIEILANSLNWVMGMCMGNHEAAGLPSERRRSSCFS